MLIVSSIWQQPAKQTTSLAMGWLLGQCPHSFTQHLRRPVVLNFFRSIALPTPPPTTTLVTPGDATKARSWLAGFKSVSIPRNMVELSFSRSSGPGGQVCFSQALLRQYQSLFCSFSQNVNKVNTKATVRCAIDSHWIPAWAKPMLQQSVRIFKTFFNLSKSAKNSPFTLPLQSLS
jgi:hypothetical protein